MNIHIRAFKPEDYPDVAHIYQAGINTGIATFEEQAPHFEDWDVRFFPECRLIATLDGKVAGWAALSLVSKRKVYSGVAEVTVYVSPDYKGMGIGSTLLKSLIEASEAAGFWTLTAHIFPENKASIALHIKHGFRIMGVHEKIAKCNGNWQDNMLLERRSTTIY